MSLLEKLGRPLRNVGAPGGVCGGVACGVQTATVEHRRAVDDAPELRVVCFPMIASERRERICAEIN